MTENSLHPERSLVDPGRIDQMDVLAPSSLDTHQHAWRGIQSIVVGCDGLPASDAAVRLAGRLAAQTGALVRAVMWLDHSRLGPALAGRTPVEDAIEAVDRQIAAATSHPEWWRLTLVTAAGSSFADICNEESADLIILPGMSMDPPVRLPGSGSIPTARVFGGAGGAPRVVLAAAATPDGESAVRAIATVIHVVTGSMVRQPDQTRPGIQVLMGEDVESARAESARAEGARTDSGMNGASGRTNASETRSAAGFPIMGVLAIAIVAYFTGVCALRLDRSPGAAAARGMVHAQAGPPASPVSSQPAASAATRTRPAPLNSSGAPQ